MRKLKNLDYIYLGIVFIFMIMAILFHQVELIHYVNIALIVLTLGMILYLYMKTKAMNQVIPYVIELVFLVIILLIYV